jgi:hypothetical protein
VAARARAGLRARLRPRDRRPGRGHRGGPVPDPVLRRRSAGPARPRGGRAVRREGQPLDPGPHRRPPDRPTHLRRSSRGTTDHPVHRPVGGPALRGGVPPRLAVGLRRPGDRLLGRPLRGRQGARDERYVQGRLELLAKHDLDVSPSPTTSSAGRLRRPVDERHRASCRRACGATASPRACGSALRRRWPTPPGRAAKLGA